MVTVGGGDGELSREEERTLGLVGGRAGEGTESTDGWDLSCKCWNGRNVANGFLETLFIS